MVLATPVLPPEKSEQAKAGRLVPGGVGGVTGGAEMRGAEALAAPVPPGVIAALGASTGPQAVRIEITSRARPARTGQWYGRGRPEVRRGGGTGRRVGLKNRCPQGRPGSTPGLGTTAVERDRPVWGFGLHTPPHSWGGVRRSRTEGPERIRPAPAPPSGEEKLRRGRHDSR